MVQQSGWVSSHTCLFNDSGTLWISVKSINIVQNPTMARVTVHLVIPYTTPAETTSTTMTALAGIHLLRMRTLLALLATSNHLFSLATADCYWPDGSNAYDMQECYSQEGADGLCCAPGDFCLVNHLCQRAGLDLSLYRGACTMPNWTEAATCTRVCMSAEHGDNMSDTQIVENCFDQPIFFVCGTGREGACAARSNPVFTMLRTSAGAHR